MIERRRLSLPRRRIARLAMSANGRQGVWSQYARRLLLPRWRMRIVDDTSLMALYRYHAVMKNGRAVEFITLRMLPGEAGISATPRHANGAVANVCQYIVIGR